MRKLYRNLFLLSLLGKSFKKLKRTKLLKKLENKMMKRTKTTHERVLSGIVFLETTILQRYQLKLWSKFLETACERVDFWSCSLLFWNFTKNEFLDMNFQELWWGSSGYLFSDHPSETLIEIIFFLSPVWGQFMEKPGKKFVLLKCVKNTCGRVTFLLNLPAVDMQYY